MAASKWTADRIPDLTGRTFVVAGANSGLAEINATHPGASLGTLARWTGRRSEHPTPAALVEAADLGAAGAYIPHVEAIHGLDQVADAHTRSQTGHARGKLVIRI